MARLRGKVGALAEESVELLVPSDREHDVARSDALLLRALGFVATQLDDLREQVLHGGGQVDRSTTADPLRVAAVFHEASDARHTEVQTSLGGSAERVDQGLAHSRGWQRGLALLAGGSHLATLPSSEVLGWDHLGDSEFGRSCVLLHTSC